MKNPLVSVIIPCKDERCTIDGLLEDISIQNISFEIEVIRIDNVGPSGKARNIGANKAKGQILIFIDSDIRLGNEFVLSNLIGCLREDKNIDIACASIRIPPSASKFQIRYAQEIPHSQTPIVQDITDVFIPTAACCAIPKDIFYKIGKFNENIVRGVDPEFAFRLRKTGYRAVISPRTWCYHSLPNNIFELIKLQLRDGQGVAFIDTFYPELNIDVHPKGVTYFSQRKGTLERIIRFFLTSIKAVFFGKILLLFAKIFYALGYFYGIFKYKLQKIKS